MGGSSHGDVSKNLANSDQVTRSDRIGRAKKNNELFFLYFFFPAVSPFLFEDIIGSVVVVVGGSVASDVRSYQNNERSKMEMV